MRPPPPQPVPAFRISRVAFQKKRPASSVHRTITSSILILYANGGLMGLVRDVCQHGSSAPPPFCRVLRYVRPPFCPRGKKEKVSMLSNESAETMEMPKPGRGTLHNHTVSDGKWTLGILQKECHHGRQPRTSFSHHRVLDSLRKTPIDLSCWL